MNPEVAHMCSLLVEQVHQYSVCSKYTPIPRYTITFAKKTNLLPRTLNIKPAPLVYTPPSLLSRHSLAGEHHYYSPSSPSWPYVESTTQVPLPSMNSSPTSLQQSSIP